MLIRAVHRRGVEPELGSWRAGRSDGQGVADALGEPFEPEAAVGARQAPAEAVGKNLRFEVELLARILAFGVEHGELVGPNARAGDRLGASVASHKFGAGDDWDIAAGIPGREVAGRTDVGAVRIWETVNGVVGGGLVQTVSQETAGVADRAEAGDRFGSTIIDIRLVARGLGALVIVHRQAE